MLTVPPWLDTAAYPFAPHTFDTGAGQLHYLDEHAPEGRTGPPIVFVHGTPTWSFEWRHLVKDLRGEYRCLALNHLGFGLSDKPVGADFRPEAHARRFTEWVRHLGLTDITLVVHDFGGPIALAYALQHPENVRAIVVLNSWLWNPRDDTHFIGAAKLLANPVGRFLYERLNVSARAILPAAYGDKRKLTPAIHRQYLAPFARPTDRASTFALLRSLLDSGDWFGGLWEQREILKTKPLLFLWGDRDPTFGIPTLTRWRKAFSEAETHVLPGAGHWPHEEEPEQVSALLRAFLAQTASLGRDADRIS